MPMGLFISALANLAMGFNSGFLFFAICWGVNGWAQSMGAPSSVVSLSRWFKDKERGSFYEFWSSSHNIGEVLIYTLTAIAASYFGWEWGFRAAAIIGVLGVIGVFVFFYDTPESKGIAPINKKI